LIAHTLPEDIKVSDVYFSILFLEKCYEEIHTVVFVCRVMRIGVEQDILERQFWHVTFGIDFLGSMFKDW
jgi:acyl-coenzyme A thioesterase PaaI-like protein